MCLHKKPTIPQTLKVQNIGGDKAYQSWTKTIVTWQKYT